MNQQTSVDRINKIRKKVREFRAFKEEEFFAFDKLKGIGTQSDGVSAGMSGSQRINMKRYCNEPIVLLPVKSKRPKEEMATHLHLPEWPCALRGSLATYSVGLDFLSANGTLMMLIKRPDPSGITLSSSQGMCCAISVCEPGLPISYVTDDLRLTEQIDDSAEWLILYCDPQLVAGDRDVAPDEDSNAFIVLASSFSAALRQDAMEAATVRGGSKAKHMHRANETLAEVVRALMNGNYNSMKVALQVNKRTLFTFPSPLAPPIVCHSPDT